MKHKLNIAWLVMSVLIFSCQKVPVTGRKQVHVIPESELISMSITQYGEALQQSKVINGTSDANMVNAVGKKIADAAVELMKQNNQSDRLKGYAWEYHLLDSKEVNAWCLPGGKIAVYSGLLPVSKTEAGLAVVMGHEVGHAIAQHGNERMTEQLAIQAGGIGLGAFISQKPAETQQIYQAAYGYGTQYGAVLPFSRMQESEADKIGLVLMAIAGYDPNEAVGLWERMKALSAGSAVPEFMSTHPSDQTRIDAIKKFLPEAMKYYKK
ncbi:MAG: M48 family metallopeptidase [Chitinophagaceae bacterium]|nr:M48 family metallopeptidase [Chitinophagaceae bacterium]